MERNGKANQKLFYKVLKNIRNEKKSDLPHIKSKTGEILTEETEIIKRWKQYFQELLCGEDNKEDNTIQTPISSGETEQEISLTELQNTIQKIKYGKAPGYDRITAEMVKNMGRKATEVLLKLLNQIWEEEQFPKDWQMALIVPIFKKGDKRDCNNYRGVTLLCTCMKIFEQIIDKRIKKRIENTMNEAQSGFRSGRSVQDHIFTIGQISEKLEQQQKKAFLALLDMEKAFDKVPRREIWKTLEKRGISNKIIRLVQKIYKNNANSVISNNTRSETFKTKEGLRQGGALSPTLFIAFMDEIIKKCTERCKKLNIGHIKMQRVDISEGVFADDVMVIAKNSIELQNNLEVWNEVLKEHGMTINKNKTKVMVLGGQHEDFNIKIEGTNIEQVTELQYLGTIIDETGTQEKEINKRIEKTIQLYHAMSKPFINKREISRETKMKVFRAIYRPVLTYGCESWVMTERQKSKLQAAEMKYIRRVRGVTKLDRMKSVDIRKELEIISTLEFIEQRQLSWWGHVQRMEEARPAKRIWEARIVKNRKRGRPRRTWDEVIGRVLKKKGTTWENARTMAKDRKEWKKFVRT